MGEKAIISLKFIIGSSAVLFVFFIVLHFVNRSDIYPIETIGIAASIMGVIGSIFALFVAIQVPKTIAKKQNDLALFEKRFELLKLLNKILNYVSEVVEYDYNSNKPLTESRYVFSLWLSSMEIDFEIHPYLDLVFSTVYDNSNNAIGYDISNKYTDLDEYTERAYLYINRQCREIDQYSYLLPIADQKVISKIAENYAKFTKEIIDSSRFELKLNPEIDSNNQQEFYNLKIGEQYKELTKSQTDGKKIIEKIQDMLRIAD